jgi:predicted metal-dependent HD superfamily phosphohydrolase
MSLVVSHVGERWRQLLGDDADADAALTELVTAYGSEGRHYHNIEHIAALLALSAEYAPHLLDPDAIDLAIFYHDAIYEPTQSDNELRSADLACQRLIRLGVVPDRTTKVARYINATKHTSTGPSGDSDLDHLLDFDLSILAAKPQAYAEYARAIRREYAIYPDLLYRPGRAKVLRAFLAMPQIYRVPELAAHWEARAKANLTAELSALSAPE